ncbi:MAG: hypothetical protein M3P82_04940 [Bacteroidota bacterium]|nr:hypothetical protein [Bacteroidota bacterium]
MVKQISFIVVVRRIKTLGIAITVGIIAIYLLGLIVAKNNTNENFEMINLLALMIVVITVPMALFIRKTMLKKVNMQNFQTTYFNAHIIPFAIIDFAALFCITTNLFVNENILYASIGLAISVAGMIICFPKEEDFEKLKSEI